MPDRPKSFLNTRLWMQFEKKAKMERELISAVQALCSAAEELSKMIPRLFPDFTLHDGTHAAGVCEWMDQLLMKLRDQASAEELAVLLMAACCHDLGMVVREKEEAALLREAESGTCPEWESFFRRRPQDRERLNGDERQRRSLLRRYVRETHHLRLRELFPRELSAEWDRVKDRVSLTLDEFCALCESHGSSLSYLESPAEELDLNLCAVLLRLADALDYDAARAPAILYRFLGLDKAEDLRAEELERQISSEEWKKNRAGRFIRSTQAQLRYAADCWEPRLEVELTEYCDWLRKELETCCRHLEEHSRRWCGSSNPVPLLLDVKFTRKNYASAKFRLKLDQDGVLKLLSGNELYDDNTVFVRELLQNAIDAVLARRACDPGFGENDGRITVDVWTDERYCWFRIQDDGIGMNQEAIEQYFLNVGHSYYSDENGLKRDLLLSKKDTSFQPISRFGIGILSCFMGGGNHNRLEVSTRRWSEPGAAKNPALRLDVTGLHGYYFLTELSRETPGEPMHGPGGAGAGGLSARGGHHRQRLHRPAGAGYDRLPRAAGQVYLLPGRADPFRGPRQRDGAGLSHPGRAGGAAGPAQPGICGRGGGEGLSLSNAGGGFSEPASGAAGCGLVQNAPPLPDPYLLSAPPDERNGGAERSPDPHR